MCCAKIPITGGFIPNCTTGAISVACTPAAQCATNAGGLVCSGTKVFRLCNQKTGQCTETGAPECCTFGEDAGSLTFCTNATDAFAGGAKCL